MNPSLPEPELSRAHPGEPASLPHVTETVPATAASPAPELDLRFLAPPQHAGELGRLGPYRVLGVLGVGGMGAVFRAHDPALDREIALKVMLPRHAASSRARRRFMKVTDQGLERPKGLPRLQELYLRQTPVGDAGLSHLAALTHLELLSLRSTRVTDAGLVHLNGLSKLTALGLDRTQVTDAALEHLRGLADLRELTLMYTGVTADGVKRLAAALPGCAITWDGGTAGPAPE